MAETSKCPRCKVTLRKTGMDLYSCPKCHQIFRENKKFRELQKLLEQIKDMSDDLKSIVEKADKE